MVETRVIRGIACDAKTLLVKQSKTRSCRRKVVKNVHDQPEAKEEVCSIITGYHRSQSDTGRVFNVVRAKGPAVWLVRRGLRRLGIPFASSVVQPLKKIPA